MTPNSEVNQMSSENAGGSRATAVLAATSLNFTVTVDAPTAFSTLPTGGDTGATVAAFFSATGATSATDVEDDTATALGLGTTTLAVGATVDRASGVFPAGSYSLPVTVRCVAN